MNELHVLFERDHKVSWHEAGDMSAFTLLTEADLLQFESTHRICLMPIYKDVLPDFLKEYHYPKDMA